jgi:hypothetical protein
MIWLSWRLRERHSLCYELPLNQPTIESFCCQQFAVGSLLLNAPIDAFSAVFFEEQHDAIRPGDVPQEEC